MTEPTKLNKYLNNEEIEQKFFDELMEKFRMAGKKHYKETPPTDSFYNQLDFSKINFSKMVYNKDLHCIDLKAVYKDALNVPFDYACLYFDNPYELHFDIDSRLYIDGAFIKKFNKIYIRLMSNYFGVDYKNNFAYYKLKEMNVWRKNRNKNNAKI